MVVVREIGNLTTRAGQWLAAWIADPLDGVHLVLVSGRRPDADRARQGDARRSAEVVGAAGEQTADVLARELRDAHLKLAPERRRKHDRRALR